MDVDGRYQRNQQERAEVGAARWTVCFLSLISLVAVDVRCQFELYRETNCTDGLLNRLNGFRIEGVINTTFLDTGGATSVDIGNATPVDTAPSTVYFRVYKNESGGYSLLCRMNVILGCDSDPPMLPYGCFCTIVGKDRYQVNFRQFASQYFSQAYVNVTWKKMDLMKLPSSYDLESTQASFLQDKALDSYSEPCRFPVFEDNEVRYCCNNTAQPCVSSIEYDGEVIAEGDPCAVFLVTMIDLYTKPFKFQHTICGNPGVTFSCVPYYELKSRGDMYLQDMNISSSEPCQFSLTQDHRVKYCCNNTAEPCISYVHFDDNEFSQNSSCVAATVSPIGLFGKVFTFYHYISGRLAVKIICVAVKVKSSTNETIEELSNFTKTEKKPHQDRTFQQLIVVACLAGLVFVISPTIVFFYLKSTKDEMA